LASITTTHTPLYEEHLRLNARMTSFGGFAMPLQYTSIREEHLAVRQAAGLFDLSHMGELRLTDAALAQRVCSRDLSGLRPGRVRYALLCTEQGGTIDDVLVYAMPEGGYLMVVNASNQDKDFAWIRDRGGRPEAVANVGADWALIGVQGPRAAGIVQRLTTAELNPVRYYAFVEDRVAGVGCLISRTGYTGEDGFELFCAPADAAALWRALLDEGSRDGLQPAGLGARDTLRLEAGMRLYGNDMDETITPLEAGLEWAVNLDTEFIGKAALTAQEQHGLSRILAGLRMLDRSIPRHGYAVVQQDRRVGTVTSGNVAFSLGYNVAMALVPPALAQPGTRLDVEVRGAHAPAEVVPLPFYHRAHPK
jgi:aminomethyltransferase